MIRADQIQAFFPGILVAGLVALAAQFLSEHYATPAMLMALLLGIALNFLSEDGSKAAEGIAFTAKSSLRMGDAFLGDRISADLLAGLEIGQIALIIGAMLATIGSGFAIAPLLGHGWRFAFLTSGSVAICGASAAMAIGAILPRDERTEERLIFTVIGVTVLSTVAMILYPIIVSQLDLSSTEAGLFLGGTIHDVAQVVGAGYSVSEETGDAATLFKLVRVAMLAPIVLVASLVIRARVSATTDGKRPPILPTFAVGFIVLAALSSFGALPGFVTETLSSASRWFLLTAIAAVGMKTHLKQILSVGPAAIALIVIQTLFLGGTVLVGLQVLT